jgi:hypothetical protein
MSWQVIVSDRARPKQSPGEKPRIGSMKDKGLWGRGGMCVCVCVCTSGPANSAAWRVRVARVACRPLDAAGGAIIAAGTRA